MQKFYLIQTKILYNPNTEILQNPKILRNTWKTYKSITQKLICVILEMHKFVNTYN